MQLLLYYKPTPTSYSRIGLTIPVEEGKLLSAAIKRIEDLERQLGHSRAASMGKGDGDGNGNDDKDSSGDEEEAKDEAPIVTPDGQPVP